MFWNANQIYNRTSDGWQMSAGERYVLFDPNFSHIHLPYNDFSDLMELLS